eukprot:2303806-Prymnesium_polylepis.2
MVRAAAATCALDEGKQPRHERQHVERRRCAVGVVAPRHQKYSHREAGVDYCRMIVFLEGVGHHCDEHIQHKDDRHSQIREHQCRPCDGERRIGQARDRRLAGIQHNIEQSIEIVDP